MQFASRRRWFALLRLTFAVGIGCAAGPSWATPARIWLSLSDDDPYRATTRLAASEPAAVEAYALPSQPLRLFIWAQPQTVDVDLPYGPTNAFRQLQNVSLDASSKGPGVHITGGSILNPDATPGMPGGERFANVVDTHHPVTLVDGDTFEKATYPQVVDDALKGLAGFTLYDATTDSGIGPTCASCPGVHGPTGPAWLLGSLDLLPQALGDAEIRLRVGRQGVIHADEFDATTMQPTTRIAFGAADEGALYNPVFDRQMNFKHDGPDAVIHVVGSLPGDFDGNTAVGGSDFLAWQRGESANPGSASDLGIWEANVGLAVSLFSPPRAGDFDGDGAVDGADFLRWQRGQSGEPLSAGDLANWQSNFGFGRLPPIAGVVVPEPREILAVALLAMLVGACRIGLRRRPRLFAAWFVLAACSATSSVAQNNSWNGPLGTEQTWNEPTYWSLGVVPDSDDQVFLNGSSADPALVTLNTSAEVDELTIGSDAQLELLSDASLVFETSGAGVFHNQGVVRFVGTAALPNPNSIFLTTDLINDGVVTTEGHDPAKNLNVNFDKVGGIYTNKGQFNGTRGALIISNGGTFNQSAGALFAGPADLRVDNGILNISGGTLELEPPTPTGFAGSTLILNGLGTANLLAGGQIDLNSTVGLRNGEFVHDGGVLNIQNGMSYFGPGLTPASVGSYVYRGGAILDNGNPGGTVLLQSTVLRIESTDAANFAFRSFTGTQPSVLEIPSGTLAPGQTIKVGVNGGAGLPTLQAAGFANSGEVRMEFGNGSSELEITSGALTNNADGLVAFSGAIFHGDFDNLGDVQVVGSSQYGPHGLSTFTHNPGASLTLNSPLTIGAGSKLLQVGGTIDYTGGSISGLHEYVSGAITTAGNAPVLVAGGTLDLQNSLTLAAGERLQVTGGAVFLGKTGNQTLTAPGGVTLSGAGLLSGVGTVVGNVTNGGRVAPGASPGIITVIGDYAQSADGILEIEVEGAAPGTGHDQLVVSGTATLAGRLEVALTNTPLYTPAIGDNITLLTAETAIDGTFHSVHFPVAPDEAYELVYAAAGGMSPASVTLRFVEPMPITFAATEETAQWTDMNDWREGAALANPESENNVVITNRFLSGRQTVRVDDPPPGSEINAAHSLSVGDPTNEIRLLVDDASLSTTTHITVDANGVIEQTGNSVLASQMLAVREGGRFTGTGTVVSNVEVGVTGAGDAVFEPGLAGVGHLDVDGDYMQGAGGLLAVDIAGDNSGGNHDTVDVAETVMLGGTIEIDVSTLDVANDFTSGATYGVLTAAEVDGMFDRVEVVGRDDVYFVVNVEPAPASATAASSSAALERVALTGFYRGDANGDGPVDEIDAQILASVLVDNGVGEIDCGAGCFVAISSLLDAFDFVDYRKNANDKRVIDFFDVPRFADALAQSQNMSLRAAYETINAAIAAALAERVVPEPLSWTLLGAGAALLLGFRGQRSARP